MRRTHLRGHPNILKRLLIHAGGFNLGLVMRHLTGIGTPRGLQGRVAVIVTLIAILSAVWSRSEALRHFLRRPIARRPFAVLPPTVCVRPLAMGTYATGC
jgi:hypothetical protein